MKSLYSCGIFLIFLISSEGYVNKAIEVTDDSFLEIKTSCSTMRGVLTSFCDYEVSGSFKLFCCAEWGFLKIWLKPTLS